MTPSNKRYGIGGLWIIWLMMVVISIGVLSSMEIRTVITLFGYGVSVDVIVAFILGLLPFLVSFIISNRQHRLPTRLFRTQFHNKITYDKPRIGEKLTLIADQEQTVYFFIETKRLCKDILRIGVRPQCNKAWLSRLLCDYNNKTRNDYDNMWILSIVDETPEFNKSFLYAEDDTAGGQWCYYKPPLEMVPGRKLVLAVTIGVLSWTGKGFIDFRIDTPDGRRVAHHPVEIISSEANK